VKRIIYSSQATYDMSPDELVDLLALAREHNTQSGLTGMLLYCSESFMQMLEGDAAAIHATYERIMADDRHTNLRLLLDVEAGSRLFPDWTMGFEHVDDEQLAASLDGFVPETEYPLVNPDLVNDGGVAQRLLMLYSRNRVA